ncbi:MAG: ATP-binding protein [Desulfobacteraceae bacterium]
MESEQIKAKLKRLTAKYEELKKQTSKHIRLIQMGTDCLHTLLSRGALDKSMAEVLTRMKNVTGFNCVNIRKINMDTDDRPMLHTLYEIVSPQELISQLGPFKVWPLSIFSEKAVQKLTTGNPYGGKVSELPEKEHAYFYLRKLLSVIALPIRIKGTLWGLITLEDTMRDCTITSEEMCILGTCGDIIGCFFECHQAEEALRIGEKKLRLLAENTLDCIWHLDMNLNFTYVNSAVKSMFGYDPEEWIGSSLADHCNKDEMKRMIKIVNSYMEDEREQSGVLFETVLRHRNGEEILVEIVGKYLTDLENNVIGIQGTTRDISERKNAEEERLRLGAQLRHSQKMEAMGTLAGGIAHDFNNILTAIIGYTELSMMDVDENARLSNNLQEIYRAGNRATDLVKQILTFCRQTEHERRAIQISPIVKEALKLLRSSIPSTIDISPIIEENLGVIMADPTQIHQIVMNLCTNAAQAMEKNGGKLVVTLDRIILDSRFDTIHPDMELGPYIKLTVSDTGYGIPPEIIDKIFDPYFTTKKMGEGTGLGLSVSQGIVKSYGGEITVESSPKRGTIFRVYLPESSGVVQEQKEAGMELPTGNQRILFVDDEPALVDMGMQRLTRLGYQVEAHTNSIEALDFFQANPNHYDLVITDMTMPNLSGDRLAKRLIEIRPDIPIILCTGYSRQISDEKAAACGIRHFLMKPITIREMADTVKRVLHQTELSP